MRKPTVAQLTDPRAVESAITEFDRLGRETFLKRNGFGKALRWYVIKNGRQYDSNAILGVALRYQVGTGLTSRDYKGGEGSAVRRLRNLGFQVIALEVTDDTVRLPEEVSATYPEGLRQTVVVDRVERSSEARLACIEAHGTRCSACGMDFGEVYGHDFDGLIHVHHLLPLSESRTEREVDPRRDLRPICPNCHAVIHYASQIRSVQEIARLYRTRRKAAG